MLRDAILYCCTNVLAVFHVRLFSSISRSFLVVFLILSLLLKLSSCFTQKMCDFTSNGLNGSILQIAPEMKQGFSNQILELR